MKMRLNKKTVIVSFLCFFLFSSPAFADKELSSLHLINKARSAGLIDEETSIVYKSWTLFAPDKLPSKYRSTFLTKCGTPVVREVERDLAKLSPSGKKLLGAHLSPSYLPTPSNYSLDKSFPAVPTEEDHFVIWYTTSGTNSVPIADGNSNEVPDYVEWVKDYSEGSLNYEVNILGYKPPPKSVLHPRLWVYLINISYYGWAAYGYFEDDSSGPNPLIAVHSNMEFAASNDDLEGKIKGALKVTIAHELFHAVKAGYDWDEDLWWDETTSVWVEDIVYPEVNDYLRYLYDWFAHPEYSLDRKSEDSSDIHKYGSVIFAKFLTEDHQYLPENFGDEIIKKIWERCETPGKNSLSSINGELNSLGTDLKTVFKNFTAANYLKDYVDGDRLPNIAIKGTYSTAVDLSNNALSHLSSNYLTFTTPQSSDLTLSFDGEDSIDWGAKVIMEGSGGGEVAEIILDVGQSGKLEVTGFGTTYSKVVLIPSNLSWGVDDKTYAFKADFLSPPENFKAFASEDEVTLTWSASTNPAVVGYNIYRSGSDWALIATLGKETTTYEDTTISPGTTYSYAITSRDSDGNESWQSPPTSTTFLILSLYNYPNPCSSYTNFVAKFSGSIPQKVLIEIYNLAGRQVERIEDLSPDSHISGTIYTYPWSGVRSLANGVYLYRLLLFYGGEVVSKKGKLAVLK